MFSVHKLKVDGIWQLVEKALFNFDFCTPLLLIFDLSRSGNVCDKKNLKDCGFLICACLSELLHFALPLLFILSVVISPDYVWVYVSNI